MIKYKNDMGVELISATPRPNLVCYMALHQCYADFPVHTELQKYTELSEAELGRRLVDKCIKFGHWSVAEQAFFTFNVWGYPHDVLVQARTHRHMSFSAQSQRYTFKQVYELGNQYVLNGIEDYSKLQELFYFREPESTYLDREGNRYLYRQEDLEKDLFATLVSAANFADRVSNGHAPEHARHLLTQNIRQHFILGCNARALLHFCDLRLPKDAQSEIRHMASSLFAEFEGLMPELAEWYRTQRMYKNKLSP